VEFEVPFQPWSEGLMVIFSSMTRTPSAIQGVHP
jgi:hypothetical protein